ncbi:JAB domain-containing protein [Mangrovibacterium diazotrophicum]|uniref:RadC-like JAB domain-containing protein n=1 Tax=Mangrovibacterium diazotrophicum TaxID=1261403 RepID=A0A419VWG6_9BACT|nr:JAB domain-containing protein [Mangrovibacterium diazotrophicum]RKD86416.1 RadC-like JAB domain-containing protein [Mangrovibacterium diazotrophicum]
MNRNTIFTSKIAEIKISYSHRVDPKQQLQITSSGDVYSAVVDGWPDLDYRESFAVLYLSRANRLLGLNWISQGGCAGTVVDVKIVLQGALKANASAIICVHNHPSANLKSSQEDRKITSKLKEACKVIDILFLDHLIISSFEYYSMADNGEI